MDTQTRSYFAERALLADGWANNVRITVKNGQVESVATETEPQEAFQLEGTVVPAMANLHSHAFQHAMAGMAEVALDPDDSFWSWRDIMYTMVGKLSPEDVRVIASMLYIKMLKAGYTQIAEFHYLHHQPDGQPYPKCNEMAMQILAAANLTGIGLTLLPVLYSYSGFGGQTANHGQRRFINDVDAYLALFSQCRAELEGQGKHKLGICFHSLRAVTPEQIDRVLDAINGDYPIHIHIAEQQKEVDDCLSWSGQRPVEWLIKHVGIDEHWCLIHATHLNTQEIEAIAKSRAVVGLCPTTEANLGDGVFPAVEYGHLGGRWGIGSDSHVSLSVVEELRTLEYGQRLTGQKRNRLYSDRQSRVGDHLYQTACQGGNQACGVNIGLNVGQRADFIVLDDRDPFIGASPSQDVLNRWLFATNDNRVKDVFVAGEAVIRHYQHASESEVTQEFTQLLARLFNH